MDYRAKEMDWERSRAAIQNSIYVTPSRSDACPTSLKSQGRSRDLWM